MSSTFVADNVDDKDESLIIIVNPDGTITVDPETLQKLIANQHQGNVSVVHMDGDGNSQLRADNQDGEHVNLTVEGFYPPLANSNSSVQINSQSHQHHQLPQHQVMQQPAATSVVASLPVAQPLMDNDILSSVADLGGEVVVDPFSEMDPEQLARLETALQSEQAKEILGHDLSDSILDVGGVLEDPTTVESMVHNDHSYVTTVVAQQPPRQQQAPVLQVVQLQPPSPQYSPDLQQLQEQEAPSNGSVAVVSPTRGMVRGRGRGKMGRIVSGHRAVATRGGLMRTDVSHVIRTLQQHQVVSNQGMLTNKTVGAGRKDVAQQEVGPRATPGTPQTPATAQPEQHKNAVEIVQKSDIAIVKKGAVLRRGGNGTHGGGRGSGRGVRGGRGGRRGDEVALKLEPREDLQLLDDEMAATLEAMHTDCSPTQPPPPPQPPDSSGGCDRAATIVTSTSSTEVPVMQHISNSTVLTPANLEMIKKREPSVVIKKLSLKTLESATGKKMAVIKALKAKDIIKPPQSATKASRKSADSTTSPQGGTKADLVEDVKKKKEKAKVSSGLGGSHHHHQSQQPQAPLVLGPELFSTPDIIRRVNSNSEKQHQAPVFPGGDDHHQKRLNPRKSDHQPPSQSHVSTTPTISIEATTISTSSVPSLNNPLPAGEVIMAESLLNTIHAEVAKESEVRDQDNKLADALLLDDLTNDGDAQYLKPASKVGNVESEILSSQIEETLERMETNGVHGNKLAVVPSSQPIAVDTVPTTNKIIIQSSNKRILHATDSALTQEVHNKNQLKKHAIVKEKKESPDSRKQATSSSGRKRKVTEKAAALQQEQQQLMRKKRKIVPSMDETTREPAVTREIPQLDPPPTYAILPSVQQQDSDSADSDVDSWNSEDDPDRLWCICQKPHNNRFMICCDTCEDWFHGKCVGVTKALGEQMEQRGIEWSCPNCRNGKYMNSSAAILSAFIPSLNSANSTTSTISLSSGYNQHQGLGDSPTETLQQTKNSTEQTQIELLECRVCKKLARNNSIYCSDVCIRKHVLSMLVAIKTETDRLQSNSRVIVRERKSGRLLTGDKAPTVEGLVDWLLAHQMFEVVQPSMLPKQQQNLIQHSAAKSSPLQQQQTTATQNNKPKSARSVSGLGSSLKQTILTTKAPTASKIPFTIKQPVNQKVGGIQLIQPQPQIVSTPKGQRTSASDQVLTIDQSGKVKRVVIKPVADSTAVTVPQNNNSVPSGKSSYATKKVPGKTIGKREKKQRKVSESKVSTGATTATLVTTSSISTSTLVTTTVTSPIEPKKEELEPVRSNVRRTLHELLDQRAKQDKEINMLSAEISLLSVEIEEELYNYFKDTGAKYKSKYRSLVFNIKDPKNLTLYKKILGRSISPSQLVRLTPDELASQELAQWREKEAKHQLEIIKKNELDLIHQAKTVVLKSRKGEEVIETKNHEASISELESALNRTAEECEAFEKNLIVQGEKKETDSELSKLEEKLKSKAKENRRKSDSRKRGDRKNDKKRDQGWSRSKKRSRCHRSRSRSRHRSNHRRSPSENHPWLHDKNKDDEEEGKPQVSTEDLDLPAIDTKPEDTILLEGSDLSSNSSDREPSSTVIINTPPYNDAEEDDQGSDDVIPVWTGTLNMTEVTKVYTMAYEVSGGCEDLAEELSDHLECVGRIQPDSVWDYVSRMKKAGTKNIVVVRFASESQQEKMNYLALYSYLNNRNRMAVIGNVSKTIKDFYVLPLASHSPIPQVLLPLDGPGFDDYRPHLLLGIIIRSRKVSHSPLSSYSSRIKTKQVSYRNRTPERSYTPPLPTDTESTTPPISQVSHTPHLAMPDDDEPYSPGEDDDPYSPGGGEDETDISQSQSSRIESSPPSFLTKGADDYSLDSIVMSPDIMKNLEEVNRMIEQKRQQIQNITFGTTTNTSLQSEEEAYSPSESFTPPGPPLAETIPFLDSKTLPNINLPSNLHEILASIKSSTAAAAVIPQQKVKSSDPIVKAYKMYRGDDDEVYEEEGDCKNRMSPLSGPLPLNPSPETSPVTLAANRDPRQRPPELSLRNPALLSQLSDAELIRRAAVEMQPLPPLQPASEESPSVYYPPPISMPPPPPLTYSHHQQPPPPLPLTPQSVAYSSYSPDTKFKYRENDKRSRQHHPRGGYHRGNGRPYRPYNRSFSYSRGGSGSPYYGRPPPSVAQVTLSHGLQSEWEEEIRNFEQRKSKAAERERRKRQLSSRSPSPSLRRRSPPLQPSHSRRRSHI